MGNLKLQIPNVTEPPSYHVLFVILWQIVGLIKTWGMTMTANPAPHRATLLITVIPEERERWACMLLF